MAKKPTTAPADATTSDPVDAVATADTTTDAPTDAADTPADAPTETPADTAAETPAEPAPEPEPEPVPVDEGGDESSLGLTVEELTARLADHGINLTVENADETVGKGYFTVTIGDDARPGLSVNNLKKPGDIVSWAHHEAVNLFPVSDYAIAFG